MSLAQLKDEVANLEPKELRQLMAFLVWKQNSQDEKLMAELTAKIDDSDPSHWVTLEELDKRLAI
jgi:hypothetical protein